MEAFQEHNYAVFHEHTVPITWSKSHPRYVRDAFSVKRMETAWLAFRMWSLRRWDVNSPQTAPWWEAHHVDESNTAVVTRGKGHGVARDCSLWDSPMDSQDGALTCSLLTPMGFQEREEAWDRETVLTAFAAVGDQPQEIVRIYDTGCLYCFNYLCIYLGPWC